MWNEILIGVGTSLSLGPLLANAFGVTMGIIFGALPGLTTAMGVALLLPLTFNMLPIEALSALLGMYCGGVYGGSITAILVGTPGTIAAAATMLEGPSFTAKGQSKKALDMATIASFIGGIISCIALMVIAPSLAKAAMLFGPVEYFAVALFGMSVVASLSSQTMLKGGVSAIFGAYLATIGADPISGELRNTFHVYGLYSGLPLIPTLIGLFAVSQIIINLESYHRKKQHALSPVSISKIGLSWSELLTNKFNILRSSLIGIFIGIIPATGVGTASYLAYSVAKRHSKHPEEYGNGSLEGIAATESANNAVTGGALIPLLTLGVPGDIITAIILGALMIQDIVPGPMLFQDQPTIVAGIFSALMISNVLMLILGFLAVRTFTKVLMIPINILMPAMLCLCAVGGYAVNNSLFDLYLIGIFGIIGYLMEKIKMPTAPLLLSMILTPIAETNFRRALVISDNDYSVFYTSPIALTIFAITAFVIVKSIYSEIQYKLQKDK